MRRIDGFHPDRLPDAGHGRVPDTLRGCNLLAAGLPRLVGGVKNLDAEGLRALLGKCLGNVEREGNIASRMLSDLNAVYPDLGLPVDGAEVQENVFAGPSLRKSECALIPEMILPADEFADAREGGFHRERNENLPVRDEFALGLRRLAEGLDRIIPKPVEALPLRPHHLRPGILRQGILRLDFRRPPGLDIIARRRPRSLLRRPCPLQRHRRR